MGQGRSREGRTQRNTARRALVDAAVKELQHPPPARPELARAVAAMSVSSSSHRRPPESAFIRQVKAHQLDRDGKPFAKADLAALVCRLNNVDDEPQYLTVYHEMSCEDLRAAIRLTIYTQRFDKAMMMGGGGQ